MLARADQVTARQPTSSASRVARSSWRLVIVTLAPRRDQPEGDRPGHAPGPEDQHLLLEERAGVLLARAAAHGRLERIHRGAVVGVVADPAAVLLEDHRVAGPRALDGALLLLQAAARSPPCEGSSRCTP